jgi:hypothetical protein
MKKIKIKLRSNCSTKLVFVKLVKDTTGLELKEAKDIVDRACDGYMSEYPVTDISFPNLDSLFKFRSEIVNVSFNGEPPIIGLSKEDERELKMLRIGVGDRNDYINFITQNILTGFCNSDELLNFALQKLNNEDLIEIINKIEY